MAYRPSEKRTPPLVSEQISFTPVMNLMVVLIPLLLSVAQYVQVSRIDYQPPPSEGEGSGERLELVVNVLPERFELSIFGATHGEHFRVIERSGQAGGIDRLHEALVAIKREQVGAPLDTVRVVDPVSGRSLVRPRYRYEDAEVIHIAASGQTGWETIVRVMDAARSYQERESGAIPLFPVPRLGQIQ